MDNGLLIEKIMMDCPICGKLHEIEKRHSEESVLIKGEQVKYDSTYYFCCNADEEQCEFMDPKMSNDNLLRARNTYRRNHGLLTSDEIVDIRKAYGLSQVELANLLGWGEATISRYESKAIQDVFYDKALRDVKEDPYEVHILLERNKSSFSDARLAELNRVIEKFIDEKGKELLSRKNLKSEYVRYDHECDENGQTLLDIDKLEAAISFFAKNDKNLHKVKLMKLLWYADALSYKKSGHTVTGLVYTHAPMGALPIGYNKISGLENVSVEEVSKPSYDHTFITFKANEKADLSCLTDEDQIILDKVSIKFRNYTGKDLKNYMHEEIAYKETRPDSVIPFSLAKTIKEF